MRIFISWSGESSRRAAVVLRDWLPDIFQGIEAFVSSEDIRKGKRWAAEIAAQLDSCNFGIVCLTPENTAAPWVLFEAGALSKSIKEASLYTLLLGTLRWGDVDGPLSHFQHTTFEKADFYKLVSSINESHGPNKQEEARLIRKFEKYWGDIEVAMGAAVETPIEPKKKRSIDDMLLELLETTNHIAKNMRSIDAPVWPMPRISESGNQLLKPNLWRSLLERVGKKSPFTRTYLQEATGELAGDTLSIVFPEEFSDHVALVDNSRNMKLIQDVLGDMGYAGIRVVFEPKEQT